MKRLTILAMILALSGCASKTEFGECIGAFDDANPDLQYKLSIRNTALAVLFSETIVVPIVVVASQARCPVAKKAAR